MYVITRHHNDYDEVLLGPVEWNTRFINQVLRSDLDNEGINVLPSDEARVPFDITTGVRARKAEIIYPPINEKIERFDGPYWTYTDELATGTYIVVNKPVDQVKGELIGQAANNRYKKEISGFTTFLEGHKVLISTEREQRNIFATGVPGAWKFKKVEEVPFNSSEDSLTRDVVVGEVWINLNQEQLDSLTTQIRQHVQSAFDWELSKITEIQSASTLTDLNFIEI